MKSFLWIIGSLLAFGGSSLELQEAHPVKRIEKALAATLEGLGHSQRLVHDRILQTRAEIAASVSDNEEALQSFDTLSRSWEEYLKQNPNFDFETVLYASSFAAKKYKGQNRGLHDEAPYVLKSFEVTRILWAEAKERDANVLAGALLEDILDKGDVPTAEIEAHFGKKIVQILQENSDSSGLTDIENREAEMDRMPTLSHSAALISLAEQLYELRELRHMEEKLRPSEALHQKILVQVAYQKRLSKLLVGTDTGLENAILEELSTWK
jgi:hypothetical protein